MAYLFLDILFCFCFIDWPEHRILVFWHVPVIFCVLTDNTKQQSLERSGGKHGNKGIESAIAAIKMAALREF